MRTWSGLVDIVSDDDVLCRCHADLAAEVRDGEQVWWGQLRGTATVDLSTVSGLALRLPDGSVGELADVDPDQEDVYHRCEFHGAGDPPF